MVKYKLENGLTVLLTPQKETKAVTVLVLIGVGSRYESSKIAGMAHFLEHILFKGTIRRPNTLILSKELDEIGAEYNGYTTKDHTGFWIKANAEHLSLALDFLADILFNSKLEEVEINREKGTIIEEYNMLADDPMSSVAWHVESLLYEHNALGRDQLGSKETIRSTNQSSMLKFKKQHYYPHNMVLSIAGRFNESQVKNLIEKFFVCQAQHKKIDFKKFVRQTSKPKLKITYKKTEQVHLAFGFISPKYTDADLPAAQVFSNILGGTMSSRLFINIRERYGLCYFIRSSLNTYQDTGNLMIHAGLDKNRIYQAVELILSELKYIKRQGVTPEELRGAKENLKGRTILNFEDSQAVAYWYASQQMLINKTQTPEQKIAEIMKVSRVDVQRVAQKILQTNKINLALIGSFKDKENFLKILKI